MDGPVEPAVGSVDFPPSGPYMYTQKPVQTVATTHKPGRSQARVVHPSSSSALLDLRQALRWMISGEGLKGSDMLVIVLTPNSNRMNVIISPSSAWAAGFRWRCPMFSL